MGLFRDMARKVQGLPTDSEIRQALNDLQIRIHAFQMLADNLDSAAGVRSEEGLGFAVRMDLLNFSLHIASSDGRLDPKEVDAINQFLDLRLTYYECKGLIEKLGLGSNTFNSDLPMSFQTLGSIVKITDAEPRKFANSMIAIYEHLGLVISSVDGDFSETERRDLDRYISRMKSYANGL